MASIKAWAILPVHWEYNDEGYNKENYDAKGIVIYFNRDVAKLACRKQNITRAGTMGREYVDRYSFSEDQIDSALAEFEDNATSDERKAEILKQLHLECFAVTEVDVDVETMANPNFNPKVV